MTPVRTFTVFEAEIQGKNESAKLDFNFDITR